MGARQVDEETIRRWIAEGIAANPGGGSSYLVYKALLSQSGTDALIATVLENTIGGVFTWSRSGVGTYTCDITGADLNDTSFCPPFFRYVGSATNFLPISDEGDIIGYYTFTISTNKIDCYVYDTDFNSVDFSTLIDDSVVPVQVIKYGA